jgi:dipeptidyl aminopeptidase/acylaminoacyl peptidase
MTSLSRVIIEEDLYRMKSVAAPELAPNGEEAVYIETHLSKDKNDYISNLYHINLQTRSRVQWTFGEDKVFLPKWSPDGSKLVFVSNRSGKNQLFLLNRDGGEARQITFCESGASNPVWSPCGRKIAYTTFLEMGKELSVSKKTNELEEVKPFVTSQLKYKSDDRGFHDNKHSQIALLELETETNIRITDDENDYGLCGWSPDGNFITVSGDDAEEKDFSFQSDIFLLDPETKMLQKITDGKGYYGQASWSPNGKYVAYIGHKREFENATHSKLWVYDCSLKEHRCLTEVMDFPVGDYMNSDSLQGVTNPGIVWSNDNESFYFIASDHGNTILYYGNIEGAMYPALLGEEQHIYEFAFDAQRQSMLIALSRPTEPGDLFSLHVPSGEVKRITDINKEWLAEKELSSPESLWMKSKDGLDIQGWLMKPVGFEKGKKYPLILEIHGGPHTMYGNTFFHEFQLLAAKGYAVLYVNPRGSYGYGQHFVDAVRGDYGGNDYEDLMAAVDFVVDEFEFIDSERIGVTGGSYGGFMVNWMVGHTDRFKAAVTQRSISNWISFYGVSDIGYYFSEWQIQSDLHDVEKLWKHSPLAYIKHIETPLLILHSEKDYRCPIEQAEQLYVGLKRENKVTKFIRFPESNHNLSRTGKPSLRVERLKAIIEWFEEYL